MTTDTPIHVAGNYFSNDWQENPNGESYLSRIREAGRPDLQEWFGDRREAFRSLTQDWRQRLVGSEVRQRSELYQSGRGYAYKSDISQFFDCIPRAKLIDQTMRTIGTPTLRNLISGAVRCELDPEDDEVLRIAKKNGIEDGVGVRQGMPLSPIFANIILRDFDREMIRRGKKMVRYADDFIVFAGTEKDCVEIDKLAREVLARHDLEIPSLDARRSKTKIAPPDQGIEFLGLRLSPKGPDDYCLVITAEQLEDIKSSLNQLKDVDQLIKKRIDITSLGRKIENRIGGYKSAYSMADNEKELLRLLNDCRANILRSILVRAFGEERVSALSPSMKRFLCHQS